MGTAEGTYIIQGHLHPSLARLFAAPSLPTQPILLPTPPPTRPSFPPTASSSALLCILLPYCAA